MALAQAFAAALAVLLTVLTGAFILLRLPAQLGGAGLDVLLLTVFYLVGMGLLRTTEQGEKITGTPLVAQEDAPPPAQEEAQEKAPLTLSARLAALTQRHALAVAVVSFALCTVVIVLVAPPLVRSAEQIATLTGLGATFVGTTLLALMTSLPELTASFVAVRMGSYDLAVGNLFGSNAFNIALLLVGDVFYTKGTLLAAAQPAHALTAMMGCALMMVALMSVVYRGERRQRFVQVDAALLVALYGGAMLLLYRAGKG